MAEPEPAKKKKNPLVFVAAGCGVLLLLSCCCLGTGFGAHSNSESSIMEVGDRFVNALHRDDLAAAYALTPPSYRAVKTQEDFERRVRSRLPALVGRMGVSVPRSPSIPDWPFHDWASLRLVPEGNAGTIEVEITDEDGWYVEHVSHYDPRDGRSALRFTADSY